MELLALLGALFAAMLLYGFVMGIKDARLTSRLLDRAEWVNRADEHQLANLVRSLLDQYGHIELDEWRLILHPNAYDKFSSAVSAELQRRAKRA
jgi:hypothetical protein